jgi:plasmid stabilization system protein ParE
LNGAPKRADGTREIVVHPNYLVIYCVASRAIEIVTVVHARPQWPTRS